MAALLLVLLAAPHGETVPPPETAAPFLVDRGPGRLPIEVPRAERLTYVVTLDLGAFEIGVGRLELSAGVEPYRPPLLAPSPAAAGAEVAWYSSRARGGYLGYALDHRIEVRHLPQAWPRVLLRDTQHGSESRRRELRFGTREGRAEVEYRSDRHCKDCESGDHLVVGSLPWSREHHCSSCERSEHRVWKEPLGREVPEEALDMLGAVYLARSFLRSERELTTFPIAERDRVWNVTLTRGERAEVRVPAGTFPTVRVRLSAEAEAGEDGEKPERFRGLFGIHGDLRVHVHETAGVPVRIEGDVPLGPLVLRVKVRLAKWGG